MKVFLNPGHSPNGFPDPGACGNGLREADITAMVGRLVDKYLTDAGLTTHLCQSDSLYQISRSANAWDADVFVSIHCNSAGTDKARGVETFSYPHSELGSELAGYIQRRIVDRFEEIDGDFLDRGLKEANFHVLRETNMPACLIELAFINNAEDARLLKEYYDDFARAIACGITDYECCVDVSTK